MAVEYVTCPSCPRVELIHSPPPPVRFCRVERDAYDRGEPWLQAVHDVCRDQYRRHGCLFSVRVSPAGSADADADGVVG